MGLSYTPTLVPMSSRRSFHCMHATWQALQPMHLEMSISLATGSAAWRTCGAAVVVAERFWISSDCIVCSPLRFLDVDQERLELRRLRVRVSDVRRQVVREVAGLGHPDEAPVDRYADRIDLLAVALQVRDALGDDRRGFQFAAVAPHLDQVAVLDAFLLRERLADLDERRRLRDRIRLDVLRPEVEVLGQA